jgi:hypothetical protein
MKEQVLEGVPNLTGMVEDFAESELHKCQKTGIITRAATEAEKIQIMKNAEQDRGELQATNLLKGPVWVAEFDGQIIGCLRARLMFEVQPFPVRRAEPTPEINSRVGQLLLESCHRWMRSFRNGLGVESAVTVCGDGDTRATLGRLGWKIPDLTGQTLFTRGF